MSVPALLQTLAEGGGSCPCRGSDQPRRPARRVQSARGRRGRSGEGRPRLPSGPPRTLEAELPIAFSDSGTRSQRPEAVGGPLAVGKEAVLTVDCPQDHRIDRSLGGDRATRSRGVFGVRWRVMFRVFDRSNGRLVSAATAMGSEFATALACARSMKNVPRATALLHVSALGFEFGCGDRHRSAPFQ
jgi:hypothetical protein